MIRKERRKKYHGRIPLPMKSEMIHKTKTTYSRKNKRNWKYQLEEEDNMSDHSEWLKQCENVLGYIDTNEEVYKFSDDQTDEIRFFVNEGAIRDQAKLLRQLDEISIVVRIRMNDSKMSDEIQGYIDMMTRPAGLR